MPVPYRPPDHPEFTYYHYLPGQLHSVLWRRWFAHNDHYRAAAQFYSLDATKLDDNGQVAVESINDAISEYNSTYGVEFKSIPEGWLTPDDLPNGDHGFYRLSSDQLIDVSAESEAYLRIQQRVRALVVWHLDLCRAGTTIWLAGNFGRRGRDRVIYE